MHNQSFFSYVSIRNPLASRELCSVKNVRIATFIITFVSVLCGLPKVLLTRGRPFHSTVQPSSYRGDLPNLPQTSQIKRYWLCQPGPRKRLNLGWKLWHRNPDFSNFTLFLILHSNFPSPIMMVEPLDPFSFTSLSSQSGIQVLGRRLNETAVPVLIVCYQHLSKLYSLQVARLLL